MSNKYRNKSEKRKLSVKTLKELENLFRSKDWKIDSSTHLSLFERFSYTLSMLTEEEQLFMIDLTKRFQKFDSGCYLDEFADPITDLRKTFPNEFIFFAPCIPEEDKCKTKSSKVALYELQSTQYSVDLGRHKIEVNDIANLKGHIGKQTIIALVDDFIGTGDTAFEAIKYLRIVTGDEFPNNRIAILSIAAMRSGFQRIKDAGIHVFTHHIYDKGITDYYRSDSLQHATEIMHNIEKKIPHLEQNFSFGYKQSESLICMKRCPNNTFPIYWLGKNTAPYER